MLNYFEQISQGGFRIRIVVQKASSFVSFLPLNGVCAMSDSLSQYHEIWMGGDVTWYEFDTEEEINIPVEIILLLKCLAGINAYIIIL